MEAGRNVSVFFDRNNDRKIRKVEIKMFWKGDEMA